MPRPSKCRRVCHFPQTLEFIPRQEGESRDPVILTVDEYEAIRLMDREGLSQEQCGVFMQVARTTVQRVYESARRKLAAALVEGRPLRIEGGEFRLCDGRSGEQDCRGCFKQQYGQQYQRPKGECSMRIAVTYEDGLIFQHFGRTEQFKVYDIAEGKVTASEVVGTNGSGHGALAGFLEENGVNAVICGGIGGGAQMALNQAGILLFGGVQGSADEAVEALLKDELIFNPYVSCDHHDAHHGEDHVCGSGCGSCGGCH